MPPAAVAVGVVGRRRHGGARRGGGGLGGRGADDAEAEGRRGQESEDRSLHATSFLVRGPEVSCNQIGAGNATRTTGLFTHSRPEPESGPPPAGRPRRRRAPPAARCTSAGAGPAPAPRWRGPRRADPTRR